MIAAGQAPPWLDAAAPVGQVLLGLALLGLGAVGVHRCRPAGRRAREQPGGARAWRIVSTGLIVGGVGQVLSGARDLLPAGWSLAVAVTGAGLLVVAGVLAVIGVLGWRADRARSGVWFDPFSRRG